MRYYINRWTFWGIFLLILLLPVSHRWKLIVKGKRTEGTALRYGPIPLIRRNSSVKYIDATEIEYTVEGNAYTFAGPENVKYPPGKKIPLIYNPSSPAEVSMYSLRGLYFHEYTSLPLILLVLWTAFYLSFNAGPRRPPKKSGDQQRKDRGKGKDHKTSRGKNKFPGPSGLQLKK